jgi:hypothetical protein
MRVLGRIWSWIDWSELYGVELVSMLYPLALLVEPDIFTARSVSPCT